MSDFTSVSVKEETAKRFRDLRDDEGATTTEFMELLIDNYGEEA